MSEALKALNNIRTLRAQTREVSLEYLEDILEKFTVIVEERREEEASQRKELEDKQAKLEAFRVKLLEEGIDPAELISSLKGQATKPNRPVSLARRNTNISTKTAAKKPGQARAARLKRLPPRLRKGKTGRFRNLISSYGGGTLPRNAMKLLYSETRPPCR
jgi:DNA-binding protein H-NS